MSGVVVRLVVLAAVVAAGFLVVGSLERRRGRLRRLRGPTPPGVILVTGVACRLCEQARRALAASGVPVRELDAEDPRAAPLVVRSLPTVMVVASDGRVLARRSGRSAVAGAARLAAMAGGEGGNG